MQSDPYPGRPAAARGDATPNTRVEPPRPARLPAGRADHGATAHTHLRVNGSACTPLAPPLATPHWPGAGCPVAPAAREGRGAAGTAARQQLDSSPHSAVRASWFPRRRGNIRTAQQLCQRFRGEHVRGKRLNRAPSQAPAGPARFAGFVSENGVPRRGPWDGGGPPVQAARQEPLLWSKALSGQWPPN